jgi:hypothetical protein
VNLAFLPFQVIKMLLNAMFKAAGLGFAVFFAPPFRPLVFSTTKMLSELLGITLTFFASGYFQCAVMASI